MPPSPRSLPPARRGAARPAWPIWLAAGVAGWAGVAWLGARLYSYVPPRAGFDLELLLVAGRRMAAGGSPYDSAMLDGLAPAAADLFYSYPPPVAQYLSLFAGVPSGVMLVTLGVAAALGLVAVTVELGRQTLNSATDLWRTVRSVGLPAAAVAPLVFPFAVAILFGNLDALFPLLYGLMLLGALGETVRSRFAGGAALAIAAVAKLHPASMGLWFVVRGLRDRRRSPVPGPDPGGTARMPGGLALAPGGWLVAFAAVAMGLAILAISLLAGGFGPWTDYMTVLQTGTGATLVDPRNAGPAAQVALVIGGGEGVARVLQIAVGLAAVGGTVAVAWRCSDTLESFAWATVASLVILPVTWFHYPVALLPVALVAWLRCGQGQRRRVLAALIGAIVIGALAVPLPVLVWLAVGLVLVAVRVSRPPGSRAAMPTRPEADQ